MTEEAQVPRYQVQTISCRSFIYDRITDKQHSHGYDLHADAEYEADRLNTQIALAPYMRQSETDPFLQIGPGSPEPGWIYRDFHPMPRDLWLALLDIIDTDNIQVVSANSRQLPPANMCRAQIWISPDGQAAWKEYLAECAP